MIRLDLLLRGLLDSPPPNAANEYIYGSREDGLIGMPLAAEDSDIAHIDGGVKLLPSRDPIICDLAWSELADEAF